MFAEIKRFLDTWSVYRSPQPATCILSHLVSFTPKYSLAAQIKYGYTDFSYFSCRTDSLSVQFVITLLKPKKKQSTEKKEEEKRRKYNQSVNC